MKPSPIAFTISVNFRDTEIRLSQNKTVIWSRISSEFSGVDLIFAIIEYVRANHDLLIGRNTAERILKSMGSALPLKIEFSQLIRGRNLTNHFPTSLEFSSIQVREAIETTLVKFESEISSIFLLPEKVDGVIVLPQRIPDDLKPSLTASRIILIGEFGQLKGLDRRLQKATNLEIVSPEDDIERLQLQLK